ncbi:hypothetical protein C8F01DRAFT_1255067 [Mycena amicta]|nr:hypothetical protein C8F01DRAFT_1255067 [Mycena amicta]
MATRLWPGYPPGYRYASKSDLHAHFDDGHTLRGGDEEIYISSDRRRAITKTVNQELPKRARRLRDDDGTDVRETDPRLAEWLPMPEDDVDGLDAVAATISSLDVELEETVVAKRKRYESDNPMATDLGASFLRQSVDFALWDSVRRGAGSFAADNAETTSIARDVLQHNTLFARSMSFRNGRESSGLRSHYSTADSTPVVCGALGLYTSSATMGFDALSPVLVYCDCRNTDGTDAVSQLLRHAWYPATTVSPATCATFNVLELFRLLRAVGNLTTHDFVRSLERLTDPTKTEDTPDRYTAFGRMARQHEYLMRMKRSGRAHETDGMAKTEPGGLAVISRFLE